MKPILSIAGTAAVKVVSDDVVPVKNVLQRHLIEFIGDRYAFNVVPQTGPGVTPSPLPVLQFQSGRHDVENTLIAILQLSVCQDGNSVTSQDTDFASIVLHDFINHLNEQFSYRFTPDNVELRYASGVVVEFTGDFVEKMGVPPMQNFIAQALDNDEIQHVFKKISFGMDPTLEFVSSLSVEAIIPTEFTIERRATSKIEANRFFCSAPLPTQKLLSLLEEIENEVVTGSHTKPVKRSKSLRP